MKTLSVSRIDAGQQYFQTKAKSRDWVAGGVMPAGDKVHAFQSRFLVLVWVCRENHTKSSCRWFCAHQ
jgi:hypothetical protein